VRYNLSYRDVEELLVERGVEVDHVTVYRWMQRFTPLLADAARFARHAPGDRWFVDETYVKVNGCMALRLPGHRPGRAGHRRAHLGSLRRR
jgi:IS6 family transposase